jgi:DNA-directed RNA polymerase specialized sigma24 family protein
MGSYSFYKVSNHATSDDLVQDTFIKTWSYLAKGGKIGMMRAFPFNAKNGCRFLI